MLVIALVVFQRRTAGGDLPRTALLPAWLRLTLGVQGVLVLALGVALLVRPLDVAPLWPWSLTVLTGRAMGAWLAAIGATALQAVWENDLRRTRLFLLGYTLVGLLELVALVRYPATVQWGMPSVWVWVGFLGSLTVVGPAGLRVARRVRARQGPVAQSTLVVMRAR